MALGIIFTGCQSNDDEVEIVKVWPKYSEESDDPGSPNGFAAGRKVGMVTDVGGIDDESFNQSAWEGMQELSSATGAEVGYVETASADDYKTNLQSLADEGNELCWGIGYACADALKDCAAGNPEVHFAVVDNAFDEVPANVTGVVFRAQEPSFLVGYIASMVSRSGKIGFVGGMKSETLDQFQYGYMAGARYAANIVGKDIILKTEYIDSFTDYEKGKAAAAKMYEDGCDVIFQAAGGAGIGVIDAAKNARRYVIGVDRDQSYLAPKNVLTSALKNVSVAVERVSVSYLSGEDIGGRNLSFGLTEGAVGIPETHPNLRDEIYDSVLRLEDRIKSGELQVPANEEEYRQFISDLEKE